MEFLWNFYVVKIVLVEIGYEFHIVRFFQNPKNRTKRGPPVLEKIISTFSDQPYYA